MATITFTIPDAALPRLLNAIVDFGGYTGTAPGGAAETQEQFVRRWQIAEWRRIIKIYERKLAVAAVVATVTSAPPPDIT